MKKILSFLTALLFMGSTLIFASGYQDVNISGNAATATALAANGANCGANQAAGGVDASGAAESCIAPDLVVGNEITNVYGSTLTRNGSGTAGDPYTINLNLGSSNLWTAQQDFKDTVSIALGYDAAGGTPNTVGVLKMWGGGDNAYALTVQAPTLGGESWTMTLPTVHGNANEFLQTNGAGVTSWATAIITEVDGVVGNEITNVSGSSLTRGGSGTGGDPYVVSLNVGNANAWTAQQDFQNTITAFGVDVAGGTTNTIGSLKFWSNGDNAYALTVSPPTLVGESWTMTLPTTHGNASQFLQTDGAGATTWATAVTAESDPVITGGRSITRSTNDIDADVELYTDTKTIYIPSPTDADDLKSIWVAPVASTITKISCESDQTVVFDLQIDDGSPAAVNGSNITCTTFATDSTLGGDTSMAAGDRMDVAIDSVASAPTWVSITFEYTKDD